MRKLLNCVFYCLKCTRISQWHCRPILQGNSGATYEVEETVGINIKLIITLGSSGTCCLYGALTRVPCPCHSTSRQ